MNKQDTCASFTSVRFPKPEIFIELFRRNLQSLWKRHVGACTSDEHQYEAFQGVLATGDIAQKCGDNLFLIYRQPTKTDRERATISDSDYPFLLPTKRHVLALLFSTATSLPGSVIPL